MIQARKERQKEEPPHPSGRVKRERKVKNNSEPVSVAIYRYRKVSITVSRQGECKIICQCKAFNISGDDFGHYAK